MSLMMDFDPTCIDKNKTKLLNKQVKIVSLGAMQRYHNVKISFRLFYELFDKYHVLF